MIRHYRLTKDDRFVGVERVTTCTQNDDILPAKITDYWLSGANFWQAEEIEYDEKVFITTLPLGIEFLKHK